MPVQGGFPNNGNGGVPTYDAVIAAVGAAYTVTLSTSVTVEDLMLSSANATLDQTGGTFSATGAIALSAGTYRLNGGTISNTVVNVSGTGSLVFGTSTANQLTGVTVNGDLNLTANAARLRIGPGTTFATAHLGNANAELGFLPGATMNNTILIEGAAGGTRFLGMTAGGALSVGAAGVIRTATGLGGDVNLGAGAQFFFAMALSNAGLISSQVSGTTMTVNPATSFTNSGTLEAINGGTLSVPAGYTQTAGVTRVDGTISAVSGATTNTITILSGRIEGRGTVNAKVANSGIIAPGLSAGTLAIGNDLSLTGTSEIHIEIGGLAQGTQFDLLTEAGTLALNLNGTLRVSLINAFTPGAANSFTVITSNQAITGAFTNVVAGRVATSDGLGSFAVTVAGNNVTLGAFIAVPEPSTAGLLVSAAFSLFGMRKSRKRAVRNFG